MLSQRSLANRQAAMRRNGPGRRRKPAVRAAVARARPEAAELVGPVHRMVELSMKTRTPAVRMDSLRGSTLNFKACGIHGWRNSR